MKQEYLLKGKFLAVVLIILVFILFLNSVILARAAGYLKLPGELTQVEVTRMAAYSFLDYSEQIAQNAGVFDSSSVREVLAQFRYEVDRSTSSDEIIRLSIDFNQKAREVIAREQDNKRRDIILGILNDDPELADFRGSATITVSYGEDNNIKIDDQTRSITPETREEIKTHEFLLDHGMWSAVELSVEDGRVSLTTARTLLDRLRMYESELAGLRQQLREVSAAAGFSEISGSGIIVELYDAEEGYSTFDIVHDRDVRNVVNELFSAGARGIAVGGQRLTATSSIRCVGPTILVNQEPIAVNPVVLKAVGEPEVLKSSLDLIASELRQFEITVNVIMEEDIVLPPYRE